MNSRSLLDEDYRIEKEEKSNSHKIILVGGVAAVGVIGAIAGVYYASRAKQEAKTAAAGISSVSGAVSQLQPEVSQLTKDIPQIESQLSSIQAGVSANASALNQLKPLIGAVSSLTSFINQINGGHIIH